MQGHFQMNIKRSNGDIHVTPEGTFNGNSAWELVNLLHATYEGKGKIFIDTRFLKEVCPFGCETFIKQLNMRRFPSNVLCFKGKKAFSIAPRGCKVIVTSEKLGHKCKGNCPNCKNRTQKEKMVFDRTTPIDKIAV